MADELYPVLTGGETPSRHLPALSGASSTTVEPAAGPGRHGLWHLGGLLRVRARGEDTGGTLAIVEEEARMGYRTPLHTHTREDEAVYVLEGTIAFRRGDQTGRARPGEVVFLPRHRPHSFHVVSEYARLLLILTPAGFEAFFGRVSAAASADRLPAPGEDRPTDPQAMACLAPEYGVTLHAPAQDRPGPAAAAADALARAGSHHGRQAAYERLAGLLTATPKIPADTRRTAATLTAVLAGEHRPEPRAAILLGITAERLATAPAPQRAELQRDLAAAVPTYLQCARRADDRAAGLACCYLLAHFPAHREAILAALVEPGSAARADTDTLARLARCLHEPDLSAPQTRAQIGRVWPSPAAWHLTGAEAETNARWHAAADVNPRAMRELWEAETSALLAYMGAAADAALDDADA